MGEIICLDRDIIGGFNCGGMGKCFILNRKLQAIIPKIYLEIQKSS